VEALIDKDSKWWNVPLIQATFNPEEARVITSIPLSPNLPPDRLIWLGTNNGIFSVRSAYHLGLEIMERDRGQSSKTEKVSAVWSSLWNLPIPNSVKVFMWRACNDILPTRLNLFKRRVIDDGRYPWCNLEEESIAHALWFCPAAKDVWNADHSIFHKCGFVEQSFLDIFQQGLNRFDKFEMALFAAIAKKIWMRRNAMIFEGISVHPNKSYADDVRLIDDFKRCLKGDEKKPKSMHENVPVLSCWKPPSEGTIKVNFDAVINNSVGYVGVGLVARDFLGNLKGAKHLSISILTDAYNAELMAASQAVIFCTQAGFLNVILEGDALKVIKDVNSPPPPLSFSKWAFDRRNQAGSCTLKFLFFCSCGENL
jgi:hypothetical protein